MLPILITSKAVPDRSRIKCALCALLLLLMILASLASSGEWLHKMLHADAGKTDHICLVNVFSKHLLNANPPESPSFAISAEEIDSILSPAELIFSTEFFSSVHGRAPPFQV